MKRTSPPSSVTGPPPKRPLGVNGDGAPRFFSGCSSLKAYDIIRKLGEGTFGEVYKGKSRQTGQLVALKKILMANEKEGFPITALREIKLLKILDHPNVLSLLEMAVERQQDPYKKKTTIFMYMVTPYMDHDLSGLLENPSVNFTVPQTKCYMKQLLEGMRYLHSMQILHRDIKAANLLINNQGILKIADFGLARKFEEPPPVKGKGSGPATRDYTNFVVTRWYRPPELLLGERAYTSAIDMWGVGCVFAEMYRGKPILPGNSDVDQAHRIFKLCGSPTEMNMPGWEKLKGCEGVKTFGPYKRRLEIEYADLGPTGVSLLSELLKLDPLRRINAIDALTHEYFQTSPLPARPQDIPKFEESHELDRRQLRQHKNAALPPAPAGGSVGIAHNNVHPWDKPANHHSRPPPWNGPHSRIPGGGGGGRPPYDGPRGGSRPPDHHPPSLPPKPGVERRPWSPGRDRRPDRDRDRQPPWAAGGAAPSRDRDRSDRHLSSGPPPSAPPRIASTVSRPRPAQPVDSYVPSYSGPGSERTARNDSKKKDQSLPRDRQWVEIVLVVTSMMMDEQVKYG
ncbi:Pkinase-domain-containing protein [Ascobolus immersus RN42]|uniref:Pkinase-domain-containing protein n=1 Tax=Ascobolus immersus RN42 TaxID=1160509 RepID=A0A3N4HRA6_ASCIM|nr:Pkinase-domain-containing protein [Ascobolus immersus RN42]